MRFKDEKIMWYADTEVLATKLANKSVSEIQEILDEHDVITLATNNKGADKLSSRAAWIVLLPLFFVMFWVKWFFTGDGHLDAWARKFKPLDSVFKYCGIK